jgi:hypothetical protein
MQCASAMMTSAARWLYRIFSHYFIKANFLNKKRKETLLNTKIYILIFSTIHCRKISHCKKRGYAVALLVEAPRYKSEGRGFDSRWCHWNFSLT